MNTSNVAEGDVHTDTTIDDAHGSADVITNAFQQFKSYIDDRLENLTNTLQAKAASTESEPLLSTKKLQRETEAQKFRYKANARQFVHNAEVLDYVQGVIKCLSQARPDSDGALTAANKALAAIQRRQKLLKLADRSEAGWLAVEEYESDELADDSDDEKRIRRAQEKASRKKKQLGLARAKRQKIAPQNLTPQAGDKQLFRGNQSINLAVLPLLIQ